MDGVRFRSIKGLDRVGDGVEATSDRHLRWEGHGKVDIVDNDLGENLQVRKVVGSPRVSALKPRVRHTLTVFWVVLSVCPLASVSL